MSEAFVTLREMSALNAMMVECAYDALSQGRMSEALNYMSAVAEDPPETTLEKERGEIARHLLIILVNILEKLQLIDGSQQLVRAIQSAEMPRLSLPPPRPFDFERRMVLLEHCNAIKRPLAKIWRPNNSAALEVAKQMISSLSGMWAEASAVRLNSPTLPQGVEKLVGADEDALSAANGGISSRLGAVRLATVAVAGGILTSIFRIASTFKSSTAVGSAGMVILAISALVVAGAFLEQWAEVKFSLEAVANVALSIAVLGVAIVAASRVRLQSVNVLRRFSDRTAREPWAMMRSSLWLIGKVIWHSSAVVFIFASFEKYFGFDLADKVTRWVMLALKALP